MTKKSLTIYLPVPYEPHTRAAKYLQKVMFFREKTPINKRRKE